MRLKRIISVLAAMAIMAAMVAVMAVPAFAAANADEAGFRGVLLSEFATEAPPGTVGENLSGSAREIGGLGQEIGSARSGNPNANPQGGGLR